MAKITILGLSDIGFFIIFNLARGFFVSLIGSILGGVILIMATRIVAGFSTTYAKAYGICFRFGITYTIVGTVLGLILIPAGFGEDGLLISGLILSPFIGSAVYGNLIKDHKTVPIGIVKGFMVYLIQLIVSLLIVLSAYFCIENFMKGSYIKAIIMIIAFAIAGYLLYTASRELSEKHLQKHSEEPANSE